MKAVRKAVTKKSGDEGSKKGSDKESGDERQ